MALRIILIGKTGSGKSSLGNSLIGLNVFKVGRGMASETAKCQWATGTRSGTTFEIVDTPGLCDTDTPEREIYREVGKSVAVASPGPHVLILALRCDRRFTQEEYQAYVKLKQLFSSEMSHYVIIVFNGIDQLGDTIYEQKRALVEEVRKQPGHLQEVLRDANNRYVGMNNKASARDKETLLQELTIKMLDTVRNNGNSYYTTRLITDVNSYVEGLIQSFAQRRKVSRSQAERSTKQAIMNDEDQASVGRIADMVHHVAAQFFMYLCSLM